MNISEVCVVGAGAIGSLLAALLSRRASVTLICRPAHAQAIARDGLRVTGVRELRAKVAATTEPSAVRTADLALITTKAFDIENAAAQIRPHLQKHATVALVQNGLGNEDVARKGLPQTLILRALTYMGVTFSGPGHVIWTAAGRTVLGAPFDADCPALQAAARLLNEADIQTEISDDIRRETWHKTLGNVGINALGAITGLRNGQLLDDEHTVETMRGLVREAEAVAKGLGYAFDAFDEVVDLARATAANKNSMLQDLEAGRRTEIDVLNGAVVRLAEKAGLSVPYNQCITHVVKALERRAADQAKRNRHAAADDANDARPA